MAKIALITGATSGIGRAISLIMAKEGYDIIATGRRASLLSDLAKELEAKFKVRVLPLGFDVRDASQVEHYLGKLSEKWSDISLLVNNAGLAVGLNPINSGVVDDWERMVDTNIKGLLYVSRIVSNIMIKRGGGHIINIGSIAGKGVYPNGNVYCATKYAVDALSKGMMMDLYTHNIRVSQVCPGAAETEFSQVRFKGDMDKAADVYKGFTPLSAEDIADVVRYVALAPPHVNISDVVIMPTAQASVSLINRKL
ncbi:MAG: NAD(P)-dependent oxidoreductase [Bacteroidetes bacterium GWE2_39_28]|nr:MAG: NAD(P)-dependent oxidoreductase [Bacteroidetes bacterium GWE2_39_28]OFY15293.1 MAG: NAD(P)-dependent oxidoreductase [Bacteroidetes bacterium GWF2_39_10]OFZ07692.1 MAG: NAD(P)-dependent oxidoreductase [Bacteroidetes bacterium RIFOXYB2_FULL_39_7]OFZ11141.1 MAG: NAD(P)-dependent oxidoreductase [Bacteroidetes bacterium RIFOXYC2_FULL_39_11]HCT93927.1 NAD(P)-dependent oxidoreductase [Rikenellaceae bacterium]